MKKLCVIMGFVSFLLGCSDPSVSREGQGYFTLSRMQISEGGRKTQWQANPEIEFDLGALKASREFPFILGNGGETEITDIELSVDNPSFIVTPTKISSLKSGNSSITPVISLGVLHGIQLNGVGFADVLETGSHIALLTITGKTSVNGTPTEVESIFQFTLEAKVMDVTLLSDDVEIDYNNYNGQFVGNEFESGLPAIPGYDFNPSNLKIKNTGNTNLTIKLSQMQTTPSEISFEIEPNETKSIVIAEPLENDHYYALVTIDSKGAVSDRSRLKQGVDGKGYLILYHIK